MTVQLSKSKYVGPNVDGNPPVPDSGTAQPVLTTETSGAVPSNIHFQAEAFSNKKYTFEQATPGFMPTGGMIPDGSPDVQEQGLPNPSPGAIDWEQGATD